MKIPEKPVMVTALVAVSLTLMGAVAAHGEDEKIDDYGLKVKSVNIEDPSITSEAGLFVEPSTQEDEIETVTHRNVIMLQIPPEANYKAGVDWIVTLSGIDGTGAPFSQEFRGKTNANPTPEGTRVEFDNIQKEVELKFVVPKGTTELPRITKGQLVVTHEDKVLRYERNPKNVTPNSLNGTFGSLVFREANLIS